MDLGREHPEQIPTEYNEEQTLRAVRKQSQTRGQRKEKIINYFPKAETVGQALKDLGFPADKQTSKRFVTFMKQLNAPDSKENSSRCREA